jgi:hypothetical protein
MVDILPDDTPLWQMLEQTASDVLGAHGYQEIRTPIVESTDLFARSIGEVTDIVEKEMYSFPDRNDESLSLRPEGTASTVVPWFSIISYSPLSVFGIEGLCFGTSVLRKADNGSFISWVSKHLG